MKKVTPRIAKIVDQLAGGSGCQHVRLSLDPIHQYPTICFYPNGWDVL
jgi:hypothetical protein